MSEKQIEVTQQNEEENYDVFAATLRKVIETMPEKRGSAAKAIMGAFQIYYSMIGGIAAKAEKLTH